MLPKVLQCMSERTGEILRQQAAPALHLPICPSLAMAEGRVYNFSAGPSEMPLEVLEEVQREMVNYKGCGMSVMEMSHRSKEFMAIAAEAEKNLRDIFGVPSDYKVLMMQGGATLQFSSIPLNMLGAKTKADYLVTGQWGEKAHKECNKYGAWDFQNQPFVLLLF